MRCIRKLIYKILQFLTFATQKQKMINKFGQTASFNFEQTLFEMLLWRSKMTQIYQRCKAQFEINVLTMIHNDML